MADSASQKSSVKISLTRSSTKEGQCGYNIDVTALEGCDIVELDKISKEALRIAKDRFKDCYYEINR